MRMPAVKSLVQHIGPQVMPIEVAERNGGIMVDVTNAIESQDVSTAELGGCGFLSQSIVGGGPPEMAWPRN